MNDLQKAGGIAALIAALAYVTGFAIMATLLNPGSTEGWSQAQKLGFLLEKKTVFQAWNLFIYVAFGIALVVLATALHERLRAATPIVMPIATAFGLIWAGLVIASGMVASVGIETAGRLHQHDPVAAGTAWTAIDAVQNGLGGGVEIVGGIWMLLISFAAWQGGTLPRPLNGLGVVVGIAGCATLVPGLGDLGAVFGLGQIFWFGWVSVLLWRNR